MSARLRRLRDPLVVAAAGLVAAAYVGLVDPNQPGHYPLCPTKAFTGLDCPGCGGLRAVHALLHGDLRGALDHNALVVLVVVPGAVVLWARWLRRSWGRSATSAEGRRDDVPVPSPALLWTALAVVVAFTVARNVTAVPALAWLGSSAS